MPHTTKNKAGFWSDLPRPFFCLAPMADVTDAAFRKIIAKYSRHGESQGGPDVFWTEFVSTDGLLSPGREVLLRDLEYSKDEHPIVAQIFGGTPENFTKAARLVEELGFDGIDINMGCPVKKIEKQGAGCNLIKDPKRAQEIIKATMAGTKLSVSVKTRIGYNKDQTEEWIGALLETKPACITIHARTRKEMSKVPPHWDAVKRAVKLRDEISPETLIVANGGILSLEEGEKIAKDTGCDGLMLGKAIFGNPWLFSPLSSGENSPEHRRGIQRIQKTYIPSIKEKLTVMLEHTKLFLELLGDIKNFALMKKHYKAYVQGFDGAKELRVKLMESDAYEEIERITKEFLSIPLSGTRD